MSSTPSRLWLTTEPEDEEYVQATMRRLLALRSRLRRNPFIPHAPTPKQTAFLLLDDREALYGGAAGGGKSDALLMAAAEHVDVPSYRALLLRKTFTDLAMAGALMDRAAEWWGPTAAMWHAGDKEWEFPSGARIAFGHLQNDNDRFKYQGAEFHFVGWDELTQWRTDVPYRYLFSRTRRLRGSNIPIRIRAATNPGGLGGEWVALRFGLTKPTNDEQRRKFAETRRVRPFVPATLKDNPHLDEEEYKASLDELDPVTKAQLLRGDWNIRPTGAYFQRERAVMCDEDEVPPKLRTVRFWDFAATEGGGDWTVGLLLGRTEDDDYYVIDVVRGQWGPKRVEDVLRETSLQDRATWGHVPVRWEQEPGASGKAHGDYLMRKVLSGLDAEPMPSSGAKDVRARGVSAAWANGRVHVVRSHWTSAFLDETDLFPPEVLGSLHDDQVDGLSGAFHAITRRRDATSVVRTNMTMGGSRVHAPLPPAVSLPAPTRSMLRRRF